MAGQDKDKMTTIKLSVSTKERLDKLRTHKRETYEEVLQNTFNILNLCKINPVKARAKLLILDKVHRKVIKQKARFPEGI